RPVTVLGLQLARQFTGTSLAGRTAASGPGRHCVAPPEGEETRARRPGARCWSKAEAPSGQGPQQRSLTSVCSWGTPPVPNRLPPVAASSGEKCPDRQNLRGRTTPFTPAPASGEIDTTSPSLNPHLGLGMDLSVTLGRLDLRNPILVASGTFGYARE